MRHWIILRKVAEPNKWDQVTSINAWTANGAIAKVKAAGTPYGYYIAVPLYWWKPQRVDE